MIAMLTNLIPWVVIFGLTAGYYILMSHGLGLGPLLSAVPAVPAALLTATLLPGWLLVIVVGLVVVGSVKWLAGTYGPLAAGGFLLAAAVIPVFSIGVLIGVIVIGFALVLIAGVLILAG